MRTLSPREQESVLGGSVYGVRGVLDHLPAGRFAARTGENVSQGRHGLDRVKKKHPIHRLAVVIGFAAVLTFTTVQPVSAACAAQEAYVNAALALVSRLSQTSRVETRDGYMKSAYASLARAQAQKCTSQRQRDRWAVADSWLGVYAARDSAAHAQHIAQPLCRSLIVAQARDGLALSWLELVQVRPRVADTSLFRHALVALQDAARELSVQIPSVTADRTAAASIVKTRVESSSSRACSQTLAVTQ